MTIRFLPFLLFFAVGFTSCDVDQTQEGELPEVDVDIDTEPGQAPEYDVDWVDVDVNTTTRMVEVPNVTVEMVEEPVEVPVLDVDWPDEYGDSEETTFMVEADVDQEAELEIEEIYTTGQRMIVLASLEKEGERLSNGQLMRVSDQVVVNAPDMDVRYYIIGDRPDGMTNTRYRYISDRSEIADMMKNGQSIYSRD
ncbi:hypothetical protein GGR26_000902 [Lewinella marina]|uniref:Uncharacterized protein n=1 Tax=Neolewinella marina TaxID=438751 RepID=A0A2G0CIH1_9BACT|nr:hypothetical protein [Neolewinella marina]NJB85157.1 hypothetical protein [Neolewinella marina]PHK99710.1 hypothetical protein CGL56_01270 [Neolewinella marina]